MSKPCTNTKHNAITCLAAGILDRAQWCNNCLDADAIDSIPMDPFSTLVQRGWGVDVAPVFPPNVESLGTHTLIIRRWSSRVDGARFWARLRHDETGPHVTPHVTRSFHLFGDDIDDLMRRAADIALRIEQGRPTGVPTETFIKDTWV